MKSKPLKTVGVDMRLNSISNLLTSEYFKIEAIGVNIRKAVSINSIILKRLMGMMFLLRISLFKLKKASLEFCIDLRSFLFVIYAMY